MADIKSQAERSKNMSAIRSRETKPEIKIRKALFAKGFRYRLNVRKLPGTPDIVLPKYRTVIFVHGCFWHGHEHCYLFVVPTTRTDFWINKIRINKENDNKAIENLLHDNWKVLTIWECSIKGKYKLKFDELIDKTVSFILSDEKQQVMRSSE